MFAKIKKFIYPFVSSVSALLIFLLMSFLLASQSSDMGGIAVILYILFGARYGLCCH